jgi:heme exporter protein D
MASGIESGGVGYVVASYVITWVVLAAMLVRTVGSVRRARAEYDQAAKGEFRT